MGTIGTTGVGDEVFREAAVRARRRRSYSLEEKQRLVAESDAPGASVSRVARRHDINANLLFTWRRQMRPTTASAFDLVPVEVIGTVQAAAPVAAAEVERPGVIEIILAGGVRVRVDGEVSEAVLRRVLSAVKAAA